MKKGIYCLIIRVKKDIKVKIGSIGHLNFKKDLYAYIGSAQNNIDKRVERHIKKTKARFWHIDYLLAKKETLIKKAFYKKADKKEECRIASLLIKSETPVNGFGCSDCNCCSHLFRLKSLKSIKKLKFKEL